MVTKDSMIDPHYTSMAQNSSLFANRRKSLAFIPAVKKHRNSPIYPDADFLVRQQKVRANGLPDPNSRSAWSNDLSVTSREVVDRLFLSLHCGAMLS